MFGSSVVLRRKPTIIHIKNIIDRIENNQIHNCLKHHYLYQKNTLPIPCIQRYCTNKKDVTLSENSSGEVTTVFGTVKETTKTIWYGGIFLVGLGLGAAVYYALFRELFSGNSVNGVYSKALDRCVKDQQVIFSLGEPVKGHGEENSRGRRRHVSPLIYEKDGINYMRMKFYLKGSRNSATAHLEMKQNEKGDYEYRYLFVQLDSYPHTVIILEDNRNKTPLAPLPTLTDLSNRL